MATLSDLLRSGYTPPTESPMTDVVAEHLRSIPRKFEENQAQQMSLLNQAFPGNTYESMMTQGDPKAMAELAMQTPFNAMIAYHGTPHNIVGKFDISKVGTGEGAQAYGHGMYFAESPKVAQTYAETTPTMGAYPSMRRSINGQEVEVGTPEAHAATLLKSQNLSLKDAKNLVKSWIDEPNAMSADENVINGWKKTLDTLNTIKKKSDVKDIGMGNLYKVDIPDEYIPNMLDWDKPLSKMTKKEAAIIEPLKQALISRNNPYDPKSFETIGQVIQSARGTNPNLEKQLLEAGIPGIKYLDEGSRAKGQGTRNFVVFDPSEVKILEKNSKPVSRKELIEEQVNKLKD